MNPAAKVRQERTLHPERFCTRCLWRIAKKSGPSPCPRHPVRPLGAALPWQPNTFDLLENAEKRRAQHAAMWPIPEQMEAIAEDRLRERERNTGITASDASSDPSHPEYYWDPAEMPTSEIDRLRAEAERGGAV